MQSGGSAPGARWAGSGLPLPFGAETPLPLPLAQQPALGAAMKKRWRRRCSHGAGPGTVMRGRRLVGGRLRQA